MVLDTQRTTIDPYLTRLAQPFTNLNPDLFSWLSLLFAALAGIILYYSTPTQELTNYYLFIAVLFIFLNGLFDALDGKIAKLTNKTSPRGDFLDHTIDRYADVLILTGLTLSPWTRPSIGLLAIIGVLLTSYMGTQAQAVGQPRNYRGLLGRADRLALLITIPLIQHITLRYPITLPYQLTIIELMLIYFAIIGNLTALQRFHHTLTWFKTNNTEKNK